MKRTQLIWLLLLLVGLVAGCGAQTDELLPKNADGFVDITVDQLAEMLEDKDFTLVNVHIPYTGEVPQTDLWIAYDHIEENLAQLPAKSEPIVLYCQAGGMSTSAAKRLVELGYTNVIELDGGLTEWEMAGYEILDLAR